MLFLLSMPTQARAWHPSKIGQLSRQAIQNSANSAIGQFKINETLPRFNFRNFQWNLQVERMPYLVVIDAIRSAYQSNRDTVFNPDLGSFQMIKLFGRAVFPSHCTVGDLVVFGRLPIEAVFRVVVNERKDTLLFDVLDAFYNRSVLAGLVPDVGVFRRKSFALESEYKTLLFYDRANRAICNRDAVNDGTAFGWSNFLTDGLVDE